ICGMRKVEAMKERIPGQIKVKKINGVGYRKLDKAFAVEEQECHPAHSIPS
ncbi:hypothetical protein, partial [Salmonella enterica]|uniref:hypothetical protein n=1 Tax=Salmonella enterica TaxID=28901 RepID=UPI00398C4A85